MKTLKLLFILFALSSVVKGQWDEIYRFSAESQVIGFSSIDSVILVGLYDSIMISTDYGNNWSRLDTIKLTQPVPYQYYISLFMSNEVIAFSGGKNPNHIHITKDFGTTWEVIEFVHFSDDYPVLEFLVKDDVCIVKTLYSLWRSENKGVSWERIDKYDDDPMNGCGGSPHCPYVHTYGTILGKEGDNYFINFKTNTVQDGNVTSSIEKGLQMSSNKGVNWNYLNISAKKLEFDNSNLYVLNESGLYKSINNGNSWNQIFPNNVLTFKVFNDTIVAIDSSYIYVK